VRVVVCVAFLIMDGDICQNKNLKQK